MKNRAKGKRSVQIDSIIVSFLVCKISSCECRDCYTFLSHLSGNVGKNQDVFERDPPHSTFSKIIWTANNAILLYHSKTLIKEKKKSI